MPYWFNVRSRRVEEHRDPERARADDLMGPYDSRADAEAALEAAARRTEAWDEQDRKDREWATGDAEAADWDSNPLSD